MQKRLKSLDEGKAPQIVNKTSLDKAIRRNALKSKTYTHNKKVMRDMKNQNSQKAEQTNRLKKCFGLFKMILKFLFGVAIIIVALLLMVAISNFIIIVI